MSTRTPTLMRRLMLSWPVAVFLLSTAAMLVASMVGVKAGIYTLPRGPFSFFDLHIYRESAGVVLNGRALYEAHFQLGFGFTYPPFAALLFLGLQAVSLTLAKVLVTAINLGLVVLLARLTVTLCERRPGAAPSPAPWRSAWLIGALALWVEPIATAIGYGQIDLLIAVLVLGDIVWARGTRWSGVGIGLAAGLKLTPLIFLPYLAVTGRWRAALRGVGAFVGSIALSFAVTPRDAWDYWGRALLDTGRVTGHRPYAGRGPADQSLRGALMRLGIGGPHGHGPWIFVCLLVLGIGFWLAMRASRHGEEGFAFVLVAITGLLICPVSWTHHWVIATPGLVLLAGSGRGSRRLATTVLAVALAAGSSAIWLIIGADQGGDHLSFGGLLLGDLYVIIGLAVLVTAAVHELSRGPLGRVGRLGRAGSATGSAVPSPGDPGDRLRRFPTGRPGRSAGQSVG